MNSFTETTTAINKVQAEVRRDLDPDQAGGKVFALNVKEGKELEKVLGDEKKAEDANANLQRQINEVIVATDRQLQLAVEAADHAQKEQDREAELQNAAKKKREQELSRLIASQNEEQKEITHQHELAAQKVEEHKARTRELDAHHSDNNSKLRFELEKDLQRKKALMDTADQEDHQKEVSRKNFEDERTRLENAVAKNQAAHEDDCKDLLETANKQGAKIDELVLMPAMLDEIEELDSKMLEADEYTNAKQEKAAAVRRQHYVGASVNSEEIQLLTLEYERKANTNKHLSSRMAYGLSNPYA